VTKRWRDTRHAPPRVTWAGVVVKLEDGTVHAVEFDGSQSFLTADVVLGGLDDGPPNWKPDVSATIRGAGRYWVQGATMAPDESPRSIEGRRALEGEVSDGAG
jgi:hypothetical protein